MVCDSMGGEKEKEKRNDRGGEWAGMGREGGGGWRERETDRQTDRKTDKDSETVRQTDTHRDRQKHRETDKDIERGV